MMMVEFIMELNWWTQLHLYLMDSTRLSNKSTNNKLVIMQNIAQIILLWLNTMPQNMWLLTESKTTENWPFCAGKLLRKIIGVGRSAIRFSNLQTCWKFDQNANCYQVIENQQDPYCTTAWQYSLQNSTEKPARTGKKNHTLSNVRIKKKNVVILK